VRAVNAVDGSNCSDFRVANERASHGAPGRVRSLSQHSYGYVKDRAG
jgi:hypothetical protein